jgi:hypothetical protein
MRFVLPLALLAAGAAQARPPDPEPDNLLNDRFGIQASIGQASADTNLRFDPDAGGLGTVLDLEDDLGLAEKKIIGRGEVWFRMRERHRVRLGTYYLPLDRRDRAVLDETIVFGNETFFVGEEVETDLSMRMFSFTYGYSLIKNQRVEAALTLGINSVSLAAEVTVPARLRTEREERSAPAPAIGVDATFRISSRWYAEVRGQYLDVEIDDVSGSLQTYELNALYRLNPNVTFGLGYSAYAVDVVSDDPGDTGFFDLSFGGPQLFARVGF